MKQLEHRAADRGSSSARRATEVLMALAGLGVVLAALLGSPLVSILLAGLLLLCPLLLWVPFRPRAGGQGGSSTDRSER